jgi:hypothetical protein
MCKTDFSDTVNGFCLKLEPIMAKNTTQKRMLAATSAKSDAKNIFQKETLRVVLIMLI